MFIRDNTALGTNRTAHVALRRATAQATSFPVFAMVLTLACVAGVGSLKGPQTSAALDGAPGTKVKDAAVAAVTQRIVAGYGDLPLAFEPTGAQAPGSQSQTFLARGRDYAIDLSSQAAILALSADGGESARPARLDLQFVGARRDVIGRAEAALPGKVHYLIGNAPHGWRTNVPTFERVRFADVYQGVDLVYYGKQGRLEYDFVVDANADPSVIALSFTGAESLVVDRDGDLLVRTAAGEVRQQRPVLYQDIDGRRQSVDGRYVIDGAEVRVEVGAYDRSKALVIDPVLIYSGGVGGLMATGVAVDASGDAYVVGQTHDPRTRDEGEVGPHGDRDIFVRKVDAAGNTVLWTTFIGGMNNESPRGIAVDGAGSAYLAGSTRSANFPTLNAYDFTYNGPAGTTSFGDAFVTKLTPDGSGFVYSTYLGSSSDDTAYGIAVRNGHAYVVGQTFTGFPTTAGAFQATKPGTHFKGFVTQLSQSGSALVYSTYLGAPSNGISPSGGYPDSAKAIALDSAGNAYVTGVTASNNFPTLNPAQTWSTPTAFTHDGRDWAFVTKLNSAGSALVYSTYLGGGLSAGGVNNGYHWTRGNAISVDAGGSAYVTGVTAAVNFPVTSGAFDSVCSVPAGATLITCGEAFVTKLSPSGSSFVYSTYLGGTTDAASNLEEGTGIAVDGAGRAHVAGTTFAVDFPLFTPFQSSTAGGNTPFYSVVSPTGAALEYSTYLGGTDAGSGANAIALDANENVHIAGNTVATDFPWVGGLPKPGGSTAHVSNASGFLTKFSPVSCAYAVAPASTISAPAAGVTGALNLTTTAGCGWAAWASVPWITVSPANGTGAGAVTYAVAPNPSTSPRTGTLNAAGVSVIVQQAGATCSATLSITSLTPPASGAAGSISVTVPSGCAWTTSTNGTSWVTLSPGSTGPGSVNYSVAQNSSGSPRSATLTIAGVAVSVQQAAAQAVCSYSLSTTTLAIPAGGGSGAINVTATAGCPWNSSSSVPWATASGGGTGSGTVSYSVSANAGGARSGSLLVAGQTVTLSQSAASGTGGVPGAPGALQAVVNDTTVTLTWNAPSTGGAPTGYSLVGRLTAGGPVLATLPMGGATSFSLSAPNGTFVLSVAATNASGVGPESSPVTVTVPQAPAAPGAPSNLASLVSGSTVSFTWSPPSSGGAVGNYVLLAGMTPGFSTPLASIPLGTSPSFAVPGVPPGTFYVRVLAQNAGGTSAASNEVAFTVAGLTAPGAPTLQTPAVNGSTVTLSWSPGPGGPPAGYTLIARATPGGAPIASVPLGGTSVSFSGVPSGTYYLALTASNAAGVSAPSVEVALVVP